MLSLNSGTLNIDYSQGESVASGNYVINYKSKWVVFNLERDFHFRTDSTKTTIRMWTLSADKSFFKTLIEDSAAFKLLNESKKIKEPKLYIKRIENHSYVTKKGELKEFVINFGPIPKRDWSNTIVTDEIRNTLTQDIDDFIQKPDYYSRYEIPYKLCLLLSGPPGMGKTSVIKAIASEKRMNLYLLSLNSITDTKLPFLFRSVKPNSIIVLEDVDCMSVGRKNEKAETSDKKSKIDDEDDSDDSDDEGNGGKSKNGVSLSGLLNAIDGIASSEGRIIIMTTNYPEKLDPALIRQERVHRHVKLEKCLEVYEKMFVRFFDNKNKDGAREFAESCLEKSLNLADVQALCIRHINDPNFNFFRKSLQKGLNHDTTPTKGIFNGA